MRKLMSSSAVAMAIAAPVAVLPATTWAAAARVSLGDAQGFFNADITGGFVLQTQPRHLSVVPPPEGSLRVVISPFAPPDTAYCILDWHVIHVTLGSEVLSDVQRATMEMWVDGVPISVSATAVKPLPIARTDSGDKVYSRGFGAIVPPGTPPVGTHTVTAQFTFGNGDGETDSSEFIVDAANSPTCTGS